MAIEAAMCDFRQDGDHCVCSLCGRSVKRSQHPCERHYATCRSERQPNGLGDRIERWLSSYGVTQERYKEVKEKFHLPPTCDCDGRKEWFNKVGAYFGIDPDRYGPHKETK